MTAEIYASGVEDGIIRQRSHAKLLIEGGTFPTISQRKARQRLATSKSKLSRILVSSRRSTQTSDRAFTASTSNHQSYLGRRVGDICFKRRYIHARLKVVRETRYALPEKNPSRRRTSTNVREAETTPTPAKVRDGNDTNSGESQGWEASTARANLQEG